MRAFVIVSGLPASGKTTLARAIAPALHLPLIDKDDILERLFVAHGVGDAAWRRRLSRESDVMFQDAAASSQGAVLTSFWHLVGMPADSGTPTEWIPTLSDRLVNVVCSCAPELAARRFLERQRHPGHLDARGSYAEVVAEFQQLSRLGPLDLGHTVTVDASGRPDVAAVVQQVRDLLESCG
jgi:hypothetical protein